MALTIVGKKSSKLKGGADYSEHLGEPAQTLKSKAAIADVSVQKTYMGKSTGPVKQDVEQLSDGVIIPAHKLGHIHVTGQHTVNLGNYESAKISVGLTLPTDVDDINESYEFALSWVNERIEKAIGDAKN